MGIKLSGKEQTWVCCVTDLMFLNLSSPSPPPLCFPQPSPWNSPSSPSVFPNYSPLLSLFFLYDFQLPPRNQNNIRWATAPCSTQRWLFILLSFSLFNINFPWLVVWDGERIFHWSTQAQAPWTGEPPFSRALKQDSEYLLWPLCKIWVS